MPNCFYSRLADIPLNVRERLTVILETETPQSDISIFCLDVQVLKKEIYCVGPCVVPGMPENEEDLIGYRIYQYFRLSNSRFLNWRIKPYDDIFMIEAEVKGLVNYAAKKGRY